MHYTLAPHAPVRLRGRFHTHACVHVSPYVRRDHAPVYAHAHALTRAHQEHTSLLRELWGLSFPEAEVRPDVPDAQWKRLGFQGNDPFTGTCLCVHAAYVACAHVCIHAFLCMVRICLRVRISVCMHARMHVSIDLSIYLQIFVRPACFPCTCCCILRRDTPIDIRRGEPVRWCLRNLSFIRTLSLALRTTYVLVVTLSGQWVDWKHVVCCLSVCQSACVRVCSLCACVSM